MSATRFAAYPDPLVESIAATETAPGSDVLESRYRRAIYEMVVSVILAGEQLLANHTTGPQRSITDEVRDMLDAIDERRAN